MSELTQEIVRELLDYDPNTGVLTWKERSPSLFNCVKHSEEWACKRWNNRCAGKPAGSLMSSNGYWRVSIFGRYYLAHRLVWLYVTGNFPNHHIDHKNGCRIDNRFDNLREVLPAQNSKNRRMNSRNTSGFTGISFNKSNCLWIAYGWKNNKRAYLGSFKTPEMAHLAYSEFCLANGYTDRHINNKL